MTVSVNILVWLSISCVYCCALVQARDLTSAVQLGGAIVAAVEHDAEEEEAVQEMQRVELEHEREQLWRILSGQADANELESILKEINEARGHKRKKMLKMLYPIIAGLLIAKAVVIPMILKMLTALSTSAFVMAKIAIFASGLLALRWIFSSPVNSHERLAVVHVPAAVKSAHSDWDDLAPSGSAWLDLKLPNIKQKYIPLAIAGGKDTPSYRYPQHNYENFYDAKPFL